MGSTPVLKFSFVVNERNVYLVLGDSRGTKLVPALLEGLRTAMPSRNFVQLIKFAPGSTLAPHGGVCAELHQYGEATHEDVEQKLGELLKPLARACGFGVKCITDEEMEDHLANDFDKCGGDSHCALNERELQGAAA